MNPNTEEKYGYDAAVECEQKDDIKSMDMINKSINDKYFRKWKWRESHKINPDWQCPICHRIMRDPVQLNNVKQHTFCRCCITKWLSNHDTNPMTNEKLKSHYILTENEHLKEQIAMLYVSADRAQQDKDIFIIPDHGFGDYTQIIPQHARIAKKFYDENLKHLDGDHHWGPWAKEKVNDLLERTLCGYNNNNDDEDDEDEQEYSLKMMDSLQEVAITDITAMINDGKDAIRNAQNAEERQEIVDRMEGDVTMFKTMVNAVIWFFKKLWNVITVPFRKVGDIIKWLFGFGQNDNQQNQLEQNWSLDNIIR